MKRIVCVIAVCVGLLAMAQAPDPGFATFAWGSTYDYVLSENRKENHEPVDRPTDWLWYAGSLNGCETEYGYHFVDRRLFSGLAFVSHRDADGNDCADTLHDFLATYNGARLTVTLDESGWWISFYQDEKP